MNERIQELIKQCTSWSEGSTWTSHEEFDKEKFAELIVRECAWIANDPAPSVYDHDSYKLGRKWASEDVLKHFGVKE